jgi:hypothetical protein
LMMMMVVVVVAAVAVGIRFEKKVSNFIFN